MNTTVCICIPAGTKVLRDDSKLIETIAASHVEAVRNRDGSYFYRLGGRRYFASAGTVRVIDEQHRNNFC